MKRVAVLGGGCGSMAAVWALTRLPNWQERFEITVYQVGWRLGGKCASGRNGEYGERIEEHGLHVWAGFYENGFRLIRECYEEADPAPGSPIQSWEDAFRKHSAVVLQERVDDRWIAWPLTFPENDAVPGTGGELPTPKQYLELLLDWLLERSGRSAKGETGGEEGPLSRAMLEHLGAGVAAGALTAGLWERLHGASHRHEETREPDPAPDLSQYSATDTLTAARHLTRALHADADLHAAADHHRLLHLIEQGVLRLEADASPRVAVRDDWRRLLMLIDLCHATLRGLLRDGVLTHGFPAIDHLEWCDWLRRNGARQATLESAVVRGIYDYVFGFVKGRRDDPQIEAGTATHGMLRLFFTYKGALFWEMQAGMGDIVFAPLYRVLRRKGVEFRFFHRVEALRLATDEQSVESIELTVQATVKDGAYEPLIEVGGVPSWPAAPLYDQLVEGETLRAEGINLESSWSPWRGVEPLRLRRGHEFDDVILGMSLAAVDVACEDLKRADTRFAEMVDKVRTVQTGSMQLWLERSAAEIGAPRPARITSAYAEDLNTWADMTFLLPRECWPQDGGPKFLAYFCGQFPDAAVIPPFTDHEFPRRELARFRAAAVEWLNRNVGHIWPGAAGKSEPQGFDWETLYDPSAAPGETRLDSQYLRVNIDPTERYVLSLPGTSRFRLRAGASGFHNLYLAGDWVATTINAGCVEAAVMAGYDAAAALSGDPAQALGGVES